MFMIKAGFIRDHQLNQLYTPPVKYFSIYYTSKYFN